jgi:hypothetical protein
MAKINKLTQEQIDELLSTLEARFEKNINLHQGFYWSNVKEKLVSNPAKLWTLFEMERTGGEPDIIGFDAKTGEYIFYDCSPESPSGRRSLCYDREALDKRKENKPVNSVLDLASEMGIELLTEEQYRELQKLGEFDKKTSSWIVTPPEIRRHGGAIYCDRRYDHVFTYHNGADSYYAARGFRGMLKI